MILFRVQTGRPLRGEYNNTHVLCFNIHAKFVYVSVWVRVVSTLAVMRLATLWPTYIATTPKRIATHRFKIAIINHYTYELGDFQYFTKTLNGFLYYICFIEGVPIWIHANRTIWWYTLIELSNEKSSSFFFYECLNFELWMSYNISWLRLKILNLTNSLKGISAIYIFLYVEIWIWSELDLTNKFDILSMFNTNKLYRYNVNSFTLFNASVFNNRRS